MRSLGYKANRSSVWFDQQDFGINQPRSPEPPVIVHFYAIDLQKLIIIISIFFFLHLKIYGSMLVYILLLS